ncbi:MAG: prolipoprotein diacylglyceryl transferase [Gammaproteobacteria bacterium]|nr:prolipoprotein diacylglyceryl transferase [Gammaproteobacteria bacterium]
MLTYPNIDPIAISLGPLKVHWYGLMYLIGFLAFLWLGKRRAKQDYISIKPEQVGDMLFYGVLGVILGGRIGYVLFYNLSQFLEDPLLIFKIWQGGMSFHGGFVGVLLAIWMYQKQLGLGFWKTMDFIAPLVPIGLCAGRIGNFINAELWGRVTDLPWGMVFPHAGSLPRHPSQLYEALLEGVALFGILWLFSSRPRPAGAVSGLFLIAYGLFRFAVEFAREPDAHIGFVAFGWLTMGHLLSIPMIVAGIILIFWVYTASKDHQQTV